MFFESLNYRASADDKETLVFDFEYSNIDENNGTSGQFIEADGIVLVWRGEESDKTTVTNIDLSSNDIAEAHVFRNTFVVDVPNDPNASLTAGNGRRLYSFTVKAGREDDIWIGQIGLAVSVSGNGVALSNLEVRRNTNNELGEIKTAIPEGSYKVPFTEAEKISAGETATFNVYGDVGGTFTEGNNIVIELEADASGSQSLGKREDCSSYRRWFRLDS